jgi:hypothetical protein
VSHKRPTDAIAQNKVGFEVGRDHRRGDHEVCELLASCRNAAEGVGEYRSMVIPIPSCESPCSACPAVHVQRDALLYLTDVHVWLWKLGERYYTVSVSALRLAIMHATLGLTLASLRKTLTMRISVSACDPNAASTRRKIVSSQPQPFLADFSPNVDMRVRSRPAAPSHMIERAWMVLLLRKGCELGAAACSRSTAAPIPNVHASRLLDQQQHAESSHPLVDFSELRLAR